MWRVHSRLTAHLQQSRFLHHFSSSAATSHSVTLNFCRHLAFILVYNSAKFHKIWSIGRYRTEHFRLHVWLTGGWLGVLNGLSPRFCIFKIFIYCIDTWEGCLTTLYNSLEAKGMSCCAPGRPECQFWGSKTGHIWLSARFLYPSRDFGAERDIVDTLGHASRPAPLAETTKLGILLHEGASPQSNSNVDKWCLLMGSGGLLGLLLLHWRVD